ncbi:kinase-like domain-containing protein [Gilbertella persicaria]|uniref:Serine/threonine protein kinase, CMGC, CDC2/CDK sub n=1 Tax=Rhizopus stolonifer TaxID=4846 RepID=A0A367KJ16_RHIST|nr:kinase-like domain-containing protein [Gilbertella persicaria]KAI8066943.1 kinase-like domain-containing protein [Gilbertella persicaria]RCI02214.1 serine/threonine protein kinase, CMGC, CDC2/CDK sub [Rhizopus stolonifer]
MKRSYEDSKEEPRPKLHRVYEGSPLSSVPSPAWSANSASPAYRPQPKHVRHFKGCSKITDYEFLDKLGEGTFGEVHKAKDKHTSQLVALKRILMHNEKEGIPITAIREIKILKQLSHKNIVPLSDIAVDRGDPTRKEKGCIYMVFPYMDHDLAGLLDNPKVKLNQPQIKTYLKQLLEGTAYLHHNKILHRDMKAANLLINNDGILQIADFGLARGMEDENKEYTNCVVTRWYRPPELFLGERRYTSAIDMWGVGCVFGELLKSRPILQGTDDLDQLKKIFHLCGSPTQDNMPGWDMLPDANKVRFEPSTRHVREEYSHYDTLAGDLMDKLLILDPKRRLTALEALEHDYFYTMPLPADPADLPKYDASHEFDRRKVKKPHRN